MIPAALSAFDILQSAAFIQPAMRLSSIPNGVQSVFKQRKIDWTEIDPLLIKIYQDRDYGAIAKLSRKTGIARTTLCQHAKRKLDMVGIRNKNLCFDKYCPAEDELLIRHYPAPRWELQRILATRGYERTTRSITHHISVLIKKELLIERDDAVEDADLIGAGALSRVMGVPLRKIQGWIDKNMLKSVRFDLPESYRRVGQHYVRRNDVAEFMKTYPAHWSVKNCDHFWLVDILTAPSLNDTILVNRQSTAGKGAPTLADHAVCA